MRRSREDTMYTYKNILRLTGTGKYCAAVRAIKVKCNTCKSRKEVVVQNSNTIHERATIKTQPNLFIPTSI